MDKNVDGENKSENKETIEKETFTDPKPQVLVTDPDEANQKVPILKKNKTNQRLLSKKYTDGLLDFDKNQI